MKRLWSIDELGDHCTLLPNERALLGNKTGATRLGFAVLLKAFQLDGRFPTAKREIPPAVISYIAKQVQVSAQAFREYDWQGRSISNHRTQIREFLGGREWTLQDDTDVAAWLVLQALATDHTLETLMAVVYTRCRELHLEPPRSEEHTSELQSRENLVCRLLLEKKKKNIKNATNVKKKQKENK